MVLSGINKSIVFTVFTLLVIYGCRPKSREEKLQGQDRRFYETIWHIAAYSINGVDAMDSVRKYKLHGKFKFGATFRNYDEIDSRILRNIDIPVNDNKNYPYDTVTSCNPYGYWNTMTEGKKLKKMQLRYSLSNECIEKVPNVNLSYVQDTLFNDREYWDVTSDNLFEIELSFESLGRKYYKKIIRD